MTGRTEPVVVQSERRRNWSDEQKLLIVQESLRPGIVVAQVARRWAISSGQLYTWRKQLLSAAAGSFIACDIIADREPIAPAALPESASVSVPDDTTTRGGGVIEVTVNSGGTLRVIGAADADTLKLVLDALLRS